MVRLVAALLTIVNLMILLLIIAELQVHPDHNNEILERSPASLRPGHAHAPIMTGQGGEGVVMIDPRVVPDEAPITHGIVSDPYRRVSGVERVPEADQ